MRFNKFITGLKDYSLETPNINLKQFKAVIYIFFKSLTPTEQDFFQKAIIKQDFIINNIKIQLTIMDFKEEHCLDTNRLTSRKV